MEMIILLRREQISSILVVYGVFTMEVTKTKADIRMHSSRIRTASSLPYGGGGSLHGVISVPSGQRPPPNRMT